MATDVTALVIVRERQRDLAVCRRLLTGAHKRFLGPLWLLPSGLRGAAAALSAFRSAADEAVDGNAQPWRSVARLRARIDRIYAGRPDPSPIDRVLARVVSEHEVPRVLFDMMLEGVAWDVEGRELDTLRDVFAYSVRVAGSIGIAMASIMGERNASTLARACDLAVAAQLTGIARDVGEDARRGRIYLPLAWLEAHEVPRRCLTRLPVFDPRLGEVVKRLLIEADWLYERALPGIAALRPECRAAVWAAARIDAETRRLIRRHDFDAVERRAQPGILRKLWLIAQAWTKRDFEEVGVDAPPLAEARTLIESVAQGT